MFAAIPETENYHRDAGKGKGEIIKAKRRTLLLLAMSSVLILCAHLYYTQSNKCLDSFKVQSLVERCCFGVIFGSTTG